QQAGPLAHTLQRVDHSRGGHLAFGYRIQHGQAVLDHITTPLGRFDYQYDDAGPAGGAPHPRLTGVRRPDGMRKTYLYEAERQSGNPYALTGITVADATGQNTQRLNTWAYDRRGRAVLSITGGPDSPA